MKAMLATEDVITTPPTINGRYGRAWLMDMDRLRDVFESIIQPDATVAAWIIEAPWAHPVWHSYFLVCVHLRPIEGIETKIYLEGATHEVVLYVLNPDAPRQQLIDEGRLRYLSPANFGAQIVKPDDATAADAIRDAAELVCDGKLSPDTDFISAWVGLFNDSMLMK